MLRTSLLWTEYYVCSYLQCAFLKRSLQTRETVTYVPCREVFSEVGTVPCREVLVKWGLSPVERFLVKWGLSLVERF